MGYGPVERSQLRHWSVSLRTKGGGKENNMKGRAPKHQILKNQRKKNHPKVKKKGRGQGKGLDRSRLRTWEDKQKKKKEKKHQCSPPPRPNNHPSGGRGFEEKFQRDCGAG